MMIVLGLLWKQYEVKCQQATNKIQRNINEVLIVDVFWKPKLLLSKLRSLLLNQFKWLALNLRSTVCVCGCARSLSQALLFVMLFLLCNGPGTALMTNERMVRGRKGPEYLERKFQGTNGPRRERSALCRVYLFSETKVPGNESFPGTKVPRNERSSERTVQGTVTKTKVPSWEQKLHHGNKSSREQIVLRTNVPAFWCMTIFNLI